MKAYCDGCRRRRVVQPGAQKCSVCAKAAATKDPKCAVCNKPFKRVFSGEKTCSQECKGIQHRRMRELSDNRMADQVDLVGLDAYWAKVAIPDYYESLRGATQWSALSSL